MRETRSDPDDHLICQLRSGNITLAETQSLLERVHGWICKFSSVPYHDAKDIAQETVIAASRAIDGFRGESSFSTWLFGIARNTVRKHFRQSKGHSDTIPLLDPPSGLDDPEAITILRMEVSEVLDALSANERQALELRINGGSYTEIATILGLPSYNAAQQAYKRASAKVGTSLRERGYFNDQSDGASNGP